MYKTDYKPLRQILMQVRRPFYAVGSNDDISYVDDPQTEPVKAFVPGLAPEALGDEGFKKRHNIEYAYVAGAMANGITSAVMVRAMAENGMMGFFGAGGLSLEEIETNIIDLQNTLNGKPFGFNLIHSLADPAHEMATVKLYLKYSIQTISAAAFMRMTPALVYYRVKGIHLDVDNKIVVPNKVIAKVSRIEIARQFFAPPPEKIISQLLEQNLITPQEARLSQKIPMAQDLTAEADSGGHTDNRPALALLPTMLALKDQYMEEFNYKEPLCVGLAGGISTPQSAAAAFSMGAGYILTGSVNQSCIEAGICDDVKKLLCSAEQADVAMAPAADMFEIGARVQVLKRGTLFPVRAEKLYKFYQSCDSFDQIDEKSQREIQDKYLLMTFEQAWQATKQFFQRIGKDNEIEKARKNPRHKMALVFRSYLGQSSRWAIQGVPERKMDYQIWCGPAIGAFNQWVKGSFLESPDNRQVATVALNILFGACVCIRASSLRFQGVDFKQKESNVNPLNTKEIFSHMA